MYITALVPVYHLLVTELAVFKILALCRNFNSQNISISIVSLLFQRNDWTKRTSIEDNIYLRKT